jgi:hypothetical protein
MGSDHRCTCGERMKVRTSKRSGDSAVQYLRCTCGAAARVAVPARDLWRRKR